MKEAKVRFDIPENEPDNTTMKNKEYHLDEGEKEAFGVFLMMRIEPIDLLAAIVPPRECKDPEVMEAMEVDQSSWLDGADIVAKAFTKTALRQKDYWTFF